MNCLANKPHLVGYFCCHLVRDVEEHWTSYQASKGVTCVSQSINASLIGYKKVLECDGVEK